MKKQLFVIFVLITFSASATGQSLSPGDPFVTNKANCETLLKTEIDYSDTKQYRWAEIHLAKCNYFMSNEIDSTLASQTADQWSYAGTKNQKLPLAGLIAHIATPQIKICYLGTRKAYVSTNDRENSRYLSPNECIITTWTPKLQVVQDATNDQRWEIRWKPI